MIMKLGMENYVLKLYKVYINDDPELTVTNFKTMPNLAKLVFVLIVGPDIRRAFTGSFALWLLYEPRYEKTVFLHMRKQRRRSAAQ